MPLTVGFDLDMTLVDSRASICDTLRVALAEAGAEVDDADLWPWVGVPLDATITGVAPDVDVEPVVARYRELYPTVGVPTVTLLPGARETVDAVRAAGGRVVVVSAKVEPAVRAVLAHVGLLTGGPDDPVVVGGLFAAAKGEALREHGAAVYVGDHPGDVAAARAADAVAVAVATGPHDAAALTDAGADVVLPDLLGFPAWLAGHRAA